MKTDQAGFLSVTHTALPAIHSKDERLEFPFGLTVDLNLQYRVPLLESQPPVCSDCQAYINIHCARAKDEPRWRCCFCGQVNSYGGSGSLQEFGSSNAVEYRLPTAQTIPGTAPARATVRNILAFDLASPQKDLETLKRAAIDAILMLPESTEVALVSYGRSLSVYRLGSSGVVQADVVPCGQNGEFTESRQLQQGVHTSTIDICREQLIRSIHSLKSQKLENSMPGLGAAVFTAVQLCQPGRSANCSSVPSEQSMQRQATSGGQILVLTAASPFDNAGSTNDDQEEQEEEKEDEVSRLLSDIGEYAYSNATSINVIAAMQNPLAAAVLDILAQGTGGSLCYHRAAGPSLAANVKRLLGHPAGLNCHLELRVSKRHLVLTKVMIKQVVTHMQFVAGHGLTVQESLGPMLPIALDGQVENERRERRRGKISKRLLEKQTWHYSVDIPEDGRGLTFLLGYSGRSMKHSAYVQVVLAWNDASGGSIVRIATQKISAALETRDPETERKAINPQTLAVVWCKLLTAEAVQKEAALTRMQAEILKRSISKSFHDFILLYGIPDEKSAGWISGPSRYKLPPELKPVALALYFYSRRLSHQGYDKSSQAAQELWQASFFAAPTNLAQRMCVPEVHTIVGNLHHQAPFGGPALEFTLASTPNNQTLLGSLGGVVDHGNEVFVWINHKATDAQRVKDSCLRLAYELACSRTPAADASVVTADSPEEVTLLNTLNPSSRDMSGPPQPHEPLVATGPSLLEWLRSQSIVPA